MSRGYEDARAAHNAAHAEPRGETLVERVAALADHWDTWPKGSLAYIYADHLRALLAPAPADDAAPDEGLTEHDHTGPDWACEACKPLTEVLRARMRWPSVHWGELHDDAWPSLARAVLAAGYVREADLREQIATEIEAHLERRVDHLYSVSFIDGMNRAAVIARKADR